MNGAAAAADLAAGARNLLIQCAGLEPGARVLIIRERPELGWYDAAAPAAVRRLAAERGATTGEIIVGAPNEDPPAALPGAIAAHDVLVYFARLGDMDRFAPATPGKTIVMSYAREASALGGPFGRLDHRAMTALKQAVDTVVAGARRIEITCPLGTALTAERAAPAAAAPPDVSIKRFPLCVPAPVDAAPLTGRVALARFLTPTGSRPYEPASLAIDGVVFARIKGGRIDGFDGPPASVAAIEAHYAHVAGLFGIDPGVAHSWHAGLHPGFAYDRSAAADPDHWSNTAFASTQILHFHTCGAYAPGEICWMTLRPEIRLDGVPLWSGGRLLTGGFAALEAVAAAWPSLATALAAEPGPIGA